MRIDKRTPSKCRDGVLNCPSQTPFSAEAAPPYGAHCCPAWGGELLKVRRIRRAGLPGFGAFA
ncbi:hypothetical protein [Bilophila sp.]|uniref:hypothetical protein n=1 Tax=Bilophila sp. TaxID=1929485 RepID=UPI003077AD50